MAIDNQDPSPGDTDNNLLRKILLRLKSFIGGGGSVPVPLPVIVEPGDIEIGAVEIKDSSSDSRATVLSSCPAVNDYGLVVRNIPCGVQQVDGSGVVQPVSGTVTVNNFPATQPVSGTVTANQGTPNILGNAWPVELSDGTFLLGTAAHPVRVDPTGTTVQPVSGTVSVVNFPSPILVDSIGQVSTNNSTTTPLAANALFTGISDDLLNWKSVHITFQSDSSAGGIIGGLQIQFSTDNINWTTFHRFPYTASGVSIVTVPAYQRYFRLLYANRATPQSTFNLSAVLKSEASEFAINSVPEDTGGGFSPPGAVLVRNIPSGTQLVDGSAVSQPVTPTKGTLTDRSGSVTLGGTSQQAMAANAARKYLLFENISTEDIYVNFTAVAAANDASFKLVPNGSLVLEDSFISTEAVNVVSATTGSKFVAKEA